MLQRDTVLGTAYVFLAALCAGFLPIFTRWIYTYSDMNPWAIVYLRFLIASISAWLLLLLLGQQYEARQLTRREVKSLITVGAFFAFAGMAAAVSLENIPATTYTLLFYTYPAMVALVAKLLGDFLGLRKWVSIGIAFVGCVLTISAPIEISHFSHLVFPLLNALAYGMYITLAGRLQIPTNLAAGSISITTTFVALFPLLLIADITLPSNWQTWAALVGLSTISTIGSIVFILRGVQYIGSTNASISSTITPLITIVLAGLLLSEVLIWQQGLGGLLIISSVVLLNVPRRYFKRGVLSQSSG